MRRLSALICIWLLAHAVASGGDNAQTTWNLTNTDGSLESGWVVSFPTGSSDFFNSRYDGLAGVPLMGISIGQADFGSGMSFPLAGLFDANLTLDPTGNTPDLESGVSVGPVPGSGELLDYVYVSFGPSCAPYIPVLDPQHVVIELPPGDSGLLSIGTDDDVPLGNFEGWTMDGYQTTALVAGWDWGLNVNVDVYSQQTGSDGTLGAFFKLGDEAGDLTQASVQYTDEFGLAFFAPYAGSLWLPALSLAGGGLAPIGDPLPTLRDGLHGWARQGTVWPYGLGGLTLDFIAVSGVPGVPGTAGVSNEVHINVLADPPIEWGVWDDGSFEDGWVVSCPAGSSDYFNVRFDTSVFTPPAEITSIRLAVMDFGTSATAFPVSGIFATNYSLDPTGNTPDLSQPYDAAPHPFPPGVFATTSAQMTPRIFDPPVPYDSLQSDDVQGVVQFPPGDPCLLGIGMDVTGWPFYKSCSTSDGYQTRADLFWYNLGIRLTGR